MKSPNPTQGFAEFHRLVVADAALHAELQNAPTLDAFIALAVTAGAARGCTFAAAEVSEALRAARRAWIERNIG